MCALERAGRGARCAVPRSGLRRAAVRACARGAAVGARAPRVVRDRDAEAWLAALFTRTRDTVVAVDRLRRPACAVHAALDAVAPDSVVAVGIFATCARRQIVAAALAVDAELSEPARMTTATAVLHVVAELDASASTRCRSGLADAARRAEEPERERAPHRRLRTRAPRTSKAAAIPNGIGRGDTRQLHPASAVAGEAQSCKTSTHSVPAPHMGAAPAMHAPLSHALSPLQ